MKIGYLITARLKSTRLPRKLLREVKGKPIFSHMLDRLKLAQRVNEIIVCTSTEEEDLPLVSLAKREGVSYFCGDPDDVLKRLSDATTAFNLDYILNITGDCPFVDPVYVDRIAKAYEETQVDLIRALDLPHGCYSYGIRPDAFREILKIKDSKHTEVWGRYFTDTDLFKVYDLPIDNPLHRRPDLRMTLDYSEDLAFFEAVFDQLYQEGKVFSLDEILTLLNQHPEIVAINQHCAQLYKKRWTAQSEISLKSRYEVQRAAILGCGSIGHRHIRNLRQLGITDIVALRSQKGHFKQLDPELGVYEVGNWEDLIKLKPDIAIISNPTSLHLATAQRLVPHVRGLFIEKPLASSQEGVETLLEAIKAHNVISFVGYNLQFHIVVKEIQRLLDEGRLGMPLIFQCQVGQWLPDWHPYEDYRRAYYARKDLGGGVALTLIHEIHLALELLGSPSTVSCLLSDSNLLTLDVDVIADMMIQHTSGAVSQIHLDFIQRPAHRMGVISCERGWISYDLIMPKVVAQFDNAAVPQIIWESSSYDGNQPYIEEMRTFLRYVREGRIRHAFDAWKATESLSVVESALAVANTDRLSDLPLQRNI
ncbi:MAG: Gfo/Idh/MocA family oxidoreductase [Anaerolineae bacterium]|nr:Gfo/Idh/MocA family oxidoreductase [Anaerolineae bacterium]